MSRTMKIAALSALALSAITLTAQVQNPTSTKPTAVAITQDGNVFFYKVKVVQRDLDAINYLHRSGSTDLKFTGTELLPNGKGSANIKSERGLLTIHADFQNLTPANGFGPEYLTYVLWAISPDGRPQNLGGSPGRRHQEQHRSHYFAAIVALIVTAEPYFSVTTPSDVVVMKNLIVDDKTNGVIEKVNAHATLLPRGIYAGDGQHSVGNPITARREVSARTVRGVQRGSVTRRCPAPKSTRPKPTRRRRST